MSRALTRIRSLARTRAGATPWRVDAPFDPRASLRFAVYAVIGILVGLVVSGLEFFTVRQALDRLVDAPVWLQAAAPGGGLVLAALILHNRTSPTTSDEYVRVFHSGADLPAKEFAPKLAAAVATLGAGGSAGLEGPSIFAGATIGQRLGTRLSWLFGPKGHRVLTSAGAAAGVAAVFRAPATGVLFALETPFQRDVARRALIPALIAASAAYLTFVSIFGVESFLPVPSGEVRLRDEVLGALLLGLLGGGVARMLAWLWLTAKKRGAAMHPALRVAVGAVTGAGVLLGARGLTGDPFTLGPGAEAVAQVALDPKNSLWIIGGAFALRALATTGTLGAGGVGGKFIPLVVQGLLLGRLVEALFHSPTPGLYPVIGLAAVLGAGYRTPLAAVMFVAETTGRAEFVIPALLATAVSQAVMGDKSVSSYQVTEREGILERRLRLPVRDVLIEVPVLGPGELITNVIDTYGSSPPAQALPVGDDSYLGLLVLRDLAAVIFELGPDAVVRDAMQEFPAVGQDVPAVEAARMMGELDSAVIPVVDSDNHAVGVVTALTMTGVMEYDPDETSIFE